MKSPRFLAALAMAAVLTTGVTTAHAATGQLQPLTAPGTFTQVGGTNTTGQDPVQESEVIDPELNKAPSQYLNTSGDIEINGTFTKTINNFPKPTQAGRYLRVSMPIKMDFTYNVDNDKMTSAQGTISNKSVYATAGSSGTITTEYQKIKMTIQDYVNSNNGISTIDLKDIEFVDKVDTNKTDKLQLPLQLNVDSQTGSVKEFSIKRIQEINKGSVNANPLPEIEIAENGSLTLEIAKIQGQSIGNQDLLTNSTTKTSHNLKLKFEYDGK